MCWCTPELRTPWCGKGNCKAPPPQVGHVWTWKVGNKVCRYYRGATDHPEFRFQLCMLAPMASGDG